MMMTLWLGGDANVTQPVVATIVNTRFLKRKYIVFRREYLSGYLSFGVKISYDKKDFYLIFF